MRSSSAVRAQPQRVQWHIQSDQTILGYAQYKAVPQPSAREHAECEEQERPAARAVFRANVGHQTFLEGHAATQPLERRLDILLSHTREQFDLRVADCTFTKLPDRTGVV